MSIVEQYTSKNFNLLPNSFNLKDALVELQVGNYGVVINEHQKPLALVVVEDLEAASAKGAISLIDVVANSSIAITVGRKVDMQEVVTSKLLEVIAEETRGAIVIDDEETIFGILPVEAVGDYLGSAEYQLRGNTMGDIGTVGDTGLGGRHQPPKCLVKCGECSYLNELSFLDRRKPPTCQNPNASAHKLKLI